MFWRFAVPLIIAGVFAMVLIGWAVAYHWDRKTQGRENAAEHDDEG